ncbi:MAG: 30S ribosomal protein S3 [Thermoplasmata archaeon]|nr:30S ribosomal protein S3 [Thermoplasmata archaeon]
MATEKKFVRENVRRLMVKEYLRERIAGAGFGGMDIQRTPMGTRISILVERPGLVIGRGGSNIAKLTEEIREKFKIDNPQIEILEAGNKATLNAQIMAEKLAEALERGWHFRRAAHSTVRRIMEAGAKGCQVIISGKLTGERHRTEKFTQGHVKYCGDIVKEVMDEGFAVAKLKPGVIGVKVRIMKPDAKLPDEISIVVPSEEAKKEVEEKEEAKEETAEEKGEKKEEKKEEMKITDLKGIGESIVKELEKMGIKSIEDLKDMSVEDLEKIKGIGKKTAKEIKEQLKKILKEVE